MGGDRCPIVDTWWQTETGGHMITPLPGATVCKPGSATLPFFGVVPIVLDAEGNEITEVKFLRGKGHALAQHIRGASFLGWTRRVITLQRGPAFVGRFHTG